MSDAKIAVVRKAWGTTGGATVDFTSTGFGTPKAAIFILSNSTSDGVITDEVQLSYGFTDGATEHCFSVLFDHNTTSSVTARLYSNAAIAGYPNTTGTGFIVKAGFNSWITDGVRIDIDTANATDRLITCILIGGSDVSVKAGTISLGTGTDPINVTTTGIRASAIFLASIGDNLTTPGWAQSGIFSHGIAVNDGADSQRHLSIYSRDAQAASDTNSYISNQAAIGQITETGLTYQAVISDIYNGGFYITPSASASDDGVGFLAVDFGGADVSLFDMEWPTTGNYAETTPGHTPFFGYIASLATPSARNTNAAGDIGLSFAAFDGTTINALSYTDVDAADPTDTSSLSEDSLRILDPDGVSDLVVASGYALDADGWDFTLTTNPASAVLGFGFSVSTSNNIIAETEGLTITTYPAVINYQGGAVAANTQGLTITTYPASIDLSGITGSTVALTLTTYPATVLPVQVVSGTGNQIMGLSLGLGLGL